LFIVSLLKEAVALALSPSALTPSRWFRKCGNRHNEPGSSVFNRDAVAAWDADGEAIMDLAQLRCADEAR
jgi:hypothetical protein